MSALLELVETTYRPMAMDCVLDLPGRWSSVGAELPENLSSEQLRAVGQRVLLMGRGAAWWIGDWYNYLMDKTKLRVRDLVDLTGYTEQTLMNMGAVARKFEISRRREKLPWSYHAEVVAYQEEQQEFWLEACEREMWTRKELRAAIKVAATVIDDIASKPETPHLLLENVPQAETEELEESSGEAKAFRQFFGESAVSAPATGSVSAPAAPVIHVDSVTMEALRRSQSNPRHSGTIRPPVLVTQEGYRGEWVATHITRNLETNVDTAVCVRVSGLTFYEKRWEAEGLPEPQRLEAWNEAHPEGEGGLAGLLVSENPGSRQYVFLGLVATFIYHAQREAEVGKVSNNEATAAPGIAQDGGGTPATPGSRAEESVPDGRVVGDASAWAGTFGQAEPWQSTVMRALMEAKAALLRAHDATPEEEWQELGMALSLNAIEPVNEWIEALQAAIEQEEAEESEQPAYGVTVGGEWKQMTEGAVEPPAPACPDCATERRLQFDPDTRVWVKRRFEEGEVAATVQQHTNGEVYVCFDEAIPAGWRHESDVRLMEEESAAESEER